MERPENQKLMLLKSLRAFEPFMCISTAAIKKTLHISLMHYTLYALDGITSKTGQPQGIWLEQKVTNGCSSNKITQYTVCATM